MKIKIFLFFIIIMILSFFSIKNLNYDDALYVYGMDELGGMNGNYTFLGEVYTGLNGTHSVVSALFYYLIYKLFNSLIILHIFTYIIYASLIFPVSGILNYYNVKRAPMKAFLFLSIPTIMLNVNTLMMDIPSFVFFIWGIFFLINENKKISLLFFIIAFLLKYLYVFSVFLIPLLSLKNRKKYFIITLISFMVLYIILYITKNTPSIIQVIQWTGSETLFNYHKIAIRFQGFILIIGLSSIFLLFNKNIYKEPLFYVSVSLGIMFASVFEQMIFSSKIIFAVLSGLGMFSLYGMFYYSDENKKLFFWFSIYSLFAIFFLPMMISRYLLLLQLPLFIILIKYYGKEHYFTGIVISIILSILFLYSDMLQTNSYYKYISGNNNKIYFTGEWAFRNAIEENGGTMLLKNQKTLEDNALVYIPKGHASYDISKEIIMCLESVYKDSLFNFPVKIYDLIAKAGFFTNANSILPFSIRNGYSVYYNVYKYKKENGRYMQQYKNKVYIWEDTPVIPVNVPETLRFFDIEDICISPVFFPDKRVNKYSDGIKLTIISKDSILYSSIIMPDDRSSINIRGVFDTINIIIDTLKNSKYDWMGLNVK